MHLYMTYNDSTSLWHTHAKPLATGFFPEGMRFAKSKGAGGMPPDLISMLVGGQASGLAGSFFGPSSGSLAGSGRSQDPRFRRGPDGRFPSRAQAGDGDDDQDSSSGWETASDDEGGEEEGERSDDEGGSGEEGNGEGVGGEDDSGSSVGSDDEGGDGDEPPSVESRRAMASAPGPSIPQPILKEWVEAAKSCSVARMSLLLSRHPDLLTASGTGLGHTALHW